MSKGEVNLRNFSAGTRSACTEVHTTVRLHYVRNAFQGSFKDRPYDTLQVDVTLTQFLPP